MTENRFYLSITDFVMKIKDIYGSCSVLDVLDFDDIESFEKFNTIVWNYIKMAKAIEDENKIIKEG